MKKIFFALLIPVITISVFGNEKIVDLKFKFKDGRKFYPVDENGNMDFGFYEFSFDKWKILPKDKTIESFNGKVDLYLIEKPIKYHRNMISGSFNVGFGLGTGTFFTVLGSIFLYNTLVINKPDYNTYDMIPN